MPHECTCGISYTQPLLYLGIILSLFVHMFPLTSSNFPVKIIWIFVFLRLLSVPDTEGVLNEAEGKLDGVRQKIGQIAEELRGEDIYQFHRAFTPGELSHSVGEN